eukprot:scaffold78717_cov25-Tisochrysis_lutea.AAC.1
MHGDVQGKWNILEVLKKFQPRSLFRYKTKAHSLQGLFANIPSTPQAHKQQEAPCLPQGPCCSPVVGGAPRFKLERAQRVGNVLQGVDDAVGVIIGGVDAPLVTCVG